MLQFQGKGEAEGLHFEKGHERNLISLGRERSRPGQWDLLGAGERWLSTRGYLLSEQEISYPWV